MRDRAAALVLAAALAVPAAGAAGDRARGRARAAACAPCHGEDGLAVQPETPHLAGQPEGYLAAQLRAFRGGKRPSEVMAVAARELSDADIADLAAWYASIAVRAEVPAR